MIFEASEQVHFGAGTDRNSSGTERNERNGSYTLAPTLIFSQVRREVKSQTPDGEGRRLCETPRGPRPQR